MAATSSLVSVERFSSSSSSSDDDAGLGLYKGILKGDESKAVKITVRTNDDDEEGGASSVTFTNLGAAVLSIRVPNAKDVIGEVRIVTYIYLTTLPYFVVGLHDNK